MSDAVSSAQFYPSDERPIPPWVLPDPLPVAENRLYVLGMRLTNGSLEFYFKQRPPVPDPSKDGPLVIRVPKDCLITLQLDPAYNWEFPRENAVTLGPMNSPDMKRYFNLVPEIVNNRCQKVQFNALFLKDGDKANLDPYALYINLDQKLPDGTPAQSLVVRIDPDIMNPGDHRIY